MHCKPSRVIFLDRDGVINRLRPDHVKSWSEFEFLTGALKALRRLREASERVVVVTNQSVVGRRIISAHDLSSMHDLMMEAIRAEGGRVERIYACIHAPTEGCKCRKPEPGLLRLAANELGIDLTQSVLVGDSLSDLEAAWCVGCQPVYVGTVGNEAFPAGVPAFDSLETAVTMLLTRGLKTSSTC